MFRRKYEVVITQQVQFVGPFLFWTRRQAEFKANELNMMARAMGYNQNWEVVKR